MSDMLDAAKRSLAEAEKLEAAHESAVRRGDENVRTLDEKMTDELTLGILQSNIAIAEALTAEGEPEEGGCYWSDDEDELCDCEPCNPNAPEDDWGAEWDADTVNGICPEDCEFCRFEEETGPEYLVDLGEMPLRYSPDPHTEYIFDPAVRVLIRWGIAG